MPKYLNDNGTEYLVQKIQEEIKEVEASIPTGGGQMRRQDMFG